MTAKFKTDYYLAVDVLRGCAACAVLLVHYRHFFMEVAGDAIADTTLQRMPFHAMLAFIYEHGHLAVQLFWLISGFVFAAAYTKRACSGGDFAVARIARLYPLHLLTLLVVATLQWISIRYTGAPQIYIHNSATDFFAQIFLASNWHGFPVSSFNFPIWSVSMEIVIYGVFWIMLPLIKKHPMSVIAIISFAGTLDWVVRGSGQMLFQCALFFFGGVFCHQLFQKFGRSFRVAIVMSSVFGLLGMLVQGTASLALLCAALVTLVSCLDAGFAGALAARLRWLGDSAYGIYLWHIPIQICILLVLKSANISSTVAFEPWFFLMFFGIVLMTARLSFVYFETPARLWVKETLTRNGLGKSRLGILLKS